MVWDVVNGAASALSLHAHRRQGFVDIPEGTGDAEIEVEEKLVRLTNLDKLFWPDLGIKKRELLQYYVDISRTLLPHLKNRAIVMKRYPNGAYGEYFFMKRAPENHPEWLDSCAIMHPSGSLIASDCQ